MSDLILVPLLALLMCVILHFVVMAAAPRLGLLDFPERYGHKRKPIPYPTGIIPLALFLGWTLTFLELTQQVQGLLAAISLLGVICFIDDRYRVPSWLRLLVQILCALLIFATGSRIYTLTNPLDSFGSMPDLIKLDTVDFHTSFFGPLPVWSGLFTVVWLTLTINALNWFDGIPGQVSTLSFLGFLTIGLLSLSDRVAQPELALLAFLLASLALGCLCFDFPPARVLMGDTGAMFFGLMLGVLTIYSGGKVATAFLVLGVPLIDSLIVIARRLLKGSSPLKGNSTNEHLHHRLLARGWSERQVIALTASLGLLFGLTALYLSTIEKFIAAVLLFLVMMGLSWYSGKQRER